MVRLVAVTGDLFLATDRIRVTLGHVQKKIRFRALVSPEPILEDLEGRAAILHPAHVRTSLILPQESVDLCLADLAWKTVQLLLNCPLVGPASAALRIARTSGRDDRVRLLTDPKRPFAFGPQDYLAIVRIRLAQGKVDTIGILGRNPFCLSRRPARLPHLVGPLGGLAAHFLSTHSGSVAGVDELSWLRC